MHFWFNLFIKTNNVGWREGHSQCCLIILNSGLWIIEYRYHWKYDPIFWYCNRIIGTATRMYVFFFSSVAIFADWLNWSLSKIVRSRNSSQPTFKMFFCSIWSDGEMNRVVEYNPTVCLINWFEIIKSLKKNKKQTNNETDKIPKCFASYL